jgi:hypothetical protein
MRLNKKIVSIISILSLLLTMLPLQIFAAGGTTGNTIVQQRLGSSDRCQTAVVITGSGWNFSENVIIGGGGDDHLVDSLAAAPLTQLLNDPILITESGRLTEVTAAELQRLGVKTAYLVSGSGVISESTQNELRALGIDIIQLGGADRFETAYNIAQDAVMLMGLAWNVQHGAKVINCSAGGNQGDNWSARSNEYNNSFGLVMNTLLNVGYDFVVVNAAGNKAVDAARNGVFVGVTTPELEKRIIVVGATTPLGDIASFSNYGNRVDVVAPGVGIYSTIATSSSTYVSYPGASMAAPHVTGVAALVWAANPGLSGTQVKQIIVDSAHESGLAVEDTRGGAIPRQTYHQVNAKAAVAKAIGESPALTTGHLADKIVDAATVTTSDPIVGIDGAVISLYSGINDPPIRRTISGRDFQYANGQYVIDNIATGRYYLTIVADGYVSETGFVQIEAGVTTFFHQLNAVPASSENGTVSGSVINAFTGSVVSGTAITLDFRCGIDYNPDSPSEVVGTTTAASGAYTISLPAGNYTVTASGDGYITTNAYVYALGGRSVTNQNVVISPAFEEGAMGAVRIVLTWEESPRDLDSHLVGPAAGGGDFHVYFSNKNYGSYANLDVDDISSYGPETVTINTFVNGTYDYYVHDYSNRSSTTSDYLRNSQAVVRIYSSDNELLRTFNVPTGGGASTI